MCWFTHPELYRALQDRIQSGVKVSLILNFDQVNFQPGGLDFFDLEKAGANIFGFTGPELLHHKFAIADKRAVLTGSFNWTRTEHRDHVLQVEHPVVVRDFLAAYHKLLAQSHLLAGLKNTVPRALFFQQLHQPVWWSASDVRRRIISGAKVWTITFTGNDPNHWEQSRREQSHTFFCKGMLSSFWDRNRTWDETAFRAWLEEHAHLRGIKAVATYCLRLRPGDVLVAQSASGMVLGTGIVGSEPERSPHFPGDVRRYIPWLAVPEHLKFDNPAWKRSSRGLRRYQGSGLGLVEALRAALEG